MRSTKLGWKLDDERRRKRPQNNNNFLNENREPGTVISYYSHQDYALGLCGYILVGLSYVLICLTFPFSLTVCLKVVQEYERAVMFRLGRILGGAKGPGLFLIVPCVDTYTKVDLRTVTFDVPPQEILTKDSVTVAVDAVVYFRVFDPVISITNVEGTKSLQEILSDRESIAQTMQAALDEGTECWGVRVERVEVAMAAEAEAAREARAKVIAAEGEQKASRALKEAADVITQSPTALQLRYLQTLTTIASEKNSTIVFPIPIEFMQAAISRF
ncbi:unnamed protein product [Didymodactylos carnosus]|uniref:Band 7 domain-containing protein n=1 Tax=Didymodactylos carnosus TaxID=1234261 RepID=A0A813UR69_9BILA|nr:unnamed protein product [Didymodactylos carnosus]CAF0949181.1 unnamed protein product [Didymodactylos carnosus]CAF3613073.1 unnamed protein product [Didymodactylos carnosus]CAF3723573.1 unnamed protein product [Didymodactylos carnosus]